MFRSGQATSGPGEAVASDGRGNANVFGLLKGGDLVPERDAPVLRQYFRIMMRRKWVIIGSLLAASILGLLLTLLSTPLYTATTRLEIARSADRIVEVRDVQRETSVSDLEFYQTQYGLLKSRSLAERVVRNLRLHDNQQFFEMFDATPAGSDAFSPATQDARIRSASSILLANLTISPTRGSSLVDVQFTSPDPQFSAQVANSWARNFIQGNLDRRFQATAYARQFLEGRLTQLRQRLEEAERLAVNYAGNEGLVTITTPSAQGAAQGGEQRSLIADSLARLNAELSTAIADRVRLESRLGAGNGGASNESLTSPALATLRQRRAEIAAEYARMLVQFEPEYPPAAALRSQVQRLDASIVAEESRISRTIQANYQDGVQRERALGARVENLRAALVRQQQRGIQYNIYQRDVDTSRQIYDALLQRYKEIGVAGGVGTNNVTIIDEAEAPWAPSSPNLILNLLLALIAGSMIGGVSALALEHIDEVISDPADVSAELKAPLLGSVPKVDEEIDVALQDPKSPITESYLAIQTSLQFATSHGIPKSLAITSTGPGEGKSTTALALARSIARSGRSIVVIDGDMRAPSVHHVLALDNKVGLSNFLSGHDAVESLLRRDVVANLAVLTAGPSPPNAAELLSGERFQELLNLVGGMFDHVIIDSPPVMGLADAPLIASRVEATVYVVAAHATRSSMVKLAMQRMAGSNARLIGVILTKFEVARSHYGYGYDYGYAYADRAAEKAQSA